MSVAALLRAVGVDAPVEPLSGGDTSRVARAGDVVVKTHDRPPPGLFAAEASGLRALAAAGVRVPAVRHVAADGIVLEYLPPGPDDWDGLATQLATLHARRVEGYGWPEPGYLATFAVPAFGHGPWSEVFAAHRLLPLVRATRLGDLGPRIERIAARLELPAEGPVLLHGDLWRGNVVMSARGAALVDPSAWWGERGVDLAMMELFGGFPPRFWSAYRAAAPIPAEVVDALPWYRLYFLLVHVWLFGDAYLGGVAEVARRYG